MSPRGRADDPRALVGARMKISFGDYTRDVSACVVFHDAHERHAYHVLCDDGHHMWASFELDAASDGARRRGTLVARNDRMEDVRADVVVLDGEARDRSGGKGGSDDEATEDDDGDDEEKDEDEDEDEDDAEEKERRRRRRASGRGVGNGAVATTTTTGRRASDGDVVEDSDAARGVVKPKKTARESRERPRQEGRNKARPAMVVNAVAMNASTADPGNGVDADATAREGARSARVRVPSKRFLESDELAALRAKRFASDRLTDRAAATNPSVTNAAGVGSANRNASSRRAAERRSADSQSDPTFDPTSTSL
jgi:hypothetical protein